MHAATHQGSRKMVSMGLVFEKRLRLGRSLKKVKVAYISTIQYGCTRMIVEIKIRLLRLVMKGLIFIHAITLCKPLDICRRVAAIESQYPYVGVVQNRLYPCHPPKRS